MRRKMVCWILSIDQLIPQPTARSKLPITKKSNNDQSTASVYTIATAGMSSNVSGARMRPVGPMKRKNWVKNLNTAVFASREVQSASEPQHFQRSICTRSFRLFCS